VDARLPKFIFFRDAIVPNAEARVHVLSPAVKYGLLVFDAINIFWNPDQPELYAFRLRDHIKRHLESARRVGRPLRVAHSYLELHRTVEAVI